MKKILLSLLFLLSFTSAVYAGEGDQFFHLNTGVMFRNTINISFGYEKELNYDNAYEIFGEAGNQWANLSDCTEDYNEYSWKNYFWGGGIVYKKSLVRWRNSTLRFNIGPIAGSFRGDCFLGAEGSFEYSYSMRSGVKIIVTQKNNVCFMHGDTFRNGLLIGFKIPL